MTQLLLEQNRGVFESFAKDTKHTFAAWETQRSLHDKYSKLVDENRLHAHFQAEATFKWQFAKRYIAQAQPLAPDGSGIAMTDEPYDLLADWEEMRKRHAQECFAFVRLHQERCLKMYDEEVSCEALQRKLRDKVVAWLAQYGYNDAGIAESMVHKSKQFVDSLVRLERPRVKNRIDKDKEQKQKREQALLDATCKWESLDVKDVLSPALLELASRGSARSKPLTVKEDSALAFLVKDNAELQEKHRIKITSSAVRVPTPKHKPKPSPRRHIPDHQKCTFIIRALELVMDACVVSFNGEVSESQDGVATGLGVAGQVANIYLSSLDNFLMQSHDIHLQFLRRYIDDILLLWSGSTLELSAIANSWHPSLKFDLSGDGYVHFLDVALHIEQNRSVSWSMYEKPLNLHLYVPANSCHPDSVFHSLYEKPLNLHLYVPANSCHPNSVFHSLQIGGFCRCLRRNSSSVDAKRSLAAFKLRLRDRGFSIVAFERIVMRYQDRNAAKQRRRNTIR
ncbi:unnamed protein product [Symbiodinium sp. CCMP2592]|nr:unnamed protein product [Symbiodinium sp. CCMP2592]